MAAEHLYADQIHQFQLTCEISHPNSRSKGWGSLVSLVHPKLLSPFGIVIAPAAGTCASFHPANPLLNHAGFNYIRPGPVPKLGLGVTGSGGLLA